MLYRYQKLLYTIKHKKAFLQVEKQVLGKNSLSGYLHDVDKVIMYPLLGVNVTHNLHRKIAKHHIPNCLKKVKHIQQAIIDWECARFTKPDKPLNARDTLHKHYPQYVNEVLPVLTKMGL